MPKTLNLLLRIDGVAPASPPGRSIAFHGITGDIYDIEWPATVRRVEGQWLWIEDHSGYNTTPRSGWVSTEDVVRLDDTSGLHDAYTYYTNEVKKYNAPGLHWLLGICLENKKHVKAAQKEYVEALRLGRQDPDGPELSVSGSNARLGARKELAILAALSALQAPFHDELNESEIDEVLVKECENALYAAYRVAGGTAKFDWPKLSMKKAKLDKGILNEFAMKLKNLPEWKNVPMPEWKDAQWCQNLSGKPDELDQDHEALKKYEQDLIDFGPLAPLFDVGNLRKMIVSNDRIGPMFEPYLGDARLRLERLRAQEAKSAFAAAYSAMRIYSMILSGDRRPHVYYEVAQAFEKAYSNRVDESTDRVDREGLFLNKLDDYRENLKADIADVHPPRPGTKPLTDKDRKSTTTYLEELVQVAEDLTKTREVFKKLNCSMLKKLNCSMLGSNPAVGDSTTIKELLSKLEHSMDTSSQEIEVLTRVDQSLTELNRLLAASMRETDDMTNIKKLLLVQLKRDLTKLLTPSSKLNDAERATISDVLKNVSRLLADGAIDDLGRKVEDFENWITTNDNPGPAVISYLGDIEALLQQIDILLTDDPNAAPRSKQGSTLPERLGNIEKCVERIETALDLNWSERLLDRPKALIDPNHEPTTSIIKADRLGYEEALFRCADLFFELSVTEETGTPVYGGDPNWYKGYQGRAELRITTINSILGEQGIVTELSGEGQDLADDGDNLNITIRRPIGASKSDIRELRLPSAASSSPLTSLSTTSPPLARRPQPSSGKTKGPSRPLQAHLQTAIDSLEQTADTLGARTKPWCNSALRYLDDAFRRQPPDLRLIYLERATVYCARLTLDPTFRDGKAALDSVTQRLQIASNKLEGLVKERTKVKGAVARITDDFIDGKEKWPWQEKPDTVTRDLQKFWKTKVAQSPDDKAAKQKLQDALSRFHDTQLTLGGIEDLKHFRDSAMKACEVANFRGDGGEGDIAALIDLATAYAFSGDFRNAEYYQNRAAYYAVGDRTFQGQLASLLDKREEYRAKIPPDDTNPVWRDAPHNLPDGLPAIPSSTSASN